MTQQNNIAWYILRTAPQAEAKVELAIKSLGYEAFTPVEYKWRKARSNSNRRRKHAYPMFIRYAFAGVPKSSTYTHLHRIKDDIDEVSGVLGWGGVPTPLKRSEVEALMEVSGESVRYVGSINPHKAALLPKVGSSAKVLDGPFQGREVKVVAIKSQKASAMLELFNSMQVVQIPIEQLESV